MFEETLPVNSYGTMLLRSKAFYAVFSGCGYESYDLVKDDKVRVYNRRPGQENSLLGNRVGRAMTLPDAINNLGKEKGNRLGIIPFHGAWVPKEEIEYVLAAFISRLCGLAEV